jgi:hypothetical protein
MKLMIFVIDQQSRSATTNEMAAIDEFNDSLQANGQWVMAAGLADPTKATLIDNTESKGIATAGSLFSDDDFYSGFWIIDAESEEVARDLAMRGSKACNRSVELRPFLR